MRNSKQAKKILLPLVVLIWGGAIYLYLNAGNKDNPTLAVSIPVGEHFHQTHSPQTYDTFALKLDYPDPFHAHGKLSTRTKREPRPQAAPNRKVQQAKTEEASGEEAIDWGIFRYQGRVRSNIDSSEIALLSIKGKLFQVRKARRYEGARIEAIWTDSIRITFQGTTQTIVH